MNVSKCSDPFSFFYIVILQPIAYFVFNLAYLTYMKNTLTFSPPHHT